MHFLHVDEVPSPDPEDLDKEGKPRLKSKAHLINLAEMPLIQVETEGQYRERTLLTFYNRVTETFVYIHSVNNLPTIAAKLRTTGAMTSDVMIC